MAGNLHPGGVVGAWIGELIAIDHVAMCTSLFRDRVPLKRGPQDLKWGLRPKRWVFAVLIFFTKVKGDRQDRRTARG
jgi:hypothetical protein